MPGTSRVIIIERDELSCRDPNRRNSAPLAPAPTRGRRDQQQSRRVHRDIWNAKREQRATAPRTPGAWRPFPELHGQPEIPSVRGCKPPSERAALRPLPSRHLAPLHLGIRGVHRDRPVRRIGESPAIEWRSRLHVLPTKSMSGGVASSARVGEARLSVTAAPQLRLRSVAARENVRKRPCRIRLRRHRSSSAGPCPPGVPPDVCPAHHGDVAAT